VPSPAAIIAVQPQAQVVSTPSAAVIADVVSAPAPPKPIASQQPQPDAPPAIANAEPDVVPAESDPAETAASSDRTQAAMNAADDTAQPEPLGEMHVEEQKLSAGEVAALERRKYQQAMAHRDTATAQQALLQVLANDPLDHNSRKQLAALYYGENQLTAAREVLQQGITLMPTNADLRLLAARVSQAMGDKQAALQSLVAISPSVANNLDFYAMRAALAQQLGQSSEAGYAYLALTRIQPSIGRWWLGLAISQEQRGLMNDAQQAYRRALLDNQLSAASRRFAQQRIQHLEP
jgi:MSHA biogenesis protein MshN